MTLSKNNPKRTKSGKAWYKFSQNPLSVIGLAIVLFVIFSALLAPWVTPYPSHSGKYVNYNETNLSPSIHHLFGTDVFGRDVFTRTIYAFRSSLIMGIVVLIIVVPIGVTLGLLAGYFKETWIDILIMRITDIFLSVPPLILALAITSVLKPNLTNAMLAVSVMWWPWYTRLVYGMATSLRNEYFVQSAELLGASKFHILFKEILPNCLSTILTKMTLDMGWVILIGASLSFVGLGEQAPKAALGSMVADGAKYLPEYWWISVFPGLAIMLIVLGFNLLGDGISDLFSMEEA
ncbi:MAG: ABC transporter permease [Candidatus Atribacteria bacterium]|nr:ABC transporter permease [Candidatus Atribacteria bacterium]